MHIHPLSPSVHYNCKLSFGVKAIAQTLEVNLGQTNKLFKKSRMKNKIKPGMSCKPAAGSIPDRESPTAHSDPSPHLHLGHASHRLLSPVTECRGEAKGRPRPLMVTLVSPRTPPPEPALDSKQAGRTLPADLLTPSPSFQAQKLPQPCPAPSPLSLRHLSCENPCMLTLAFASRVTWSTGPR